MPRGPAKGGTFITLHDRNFKLRVLAKINSQPRGLLHIRTISRLAQCSASDSAKSRGFLLNMI